MAKEKKEKQPKEDSGILLPVLTTLLVFVGIVEFMLLTIIGVNVVPYVMALSTTSSVAESTETSGAPRTQTQAQAAAAQTPTPIPSEAAGLENSPTPDTTSEESTAPESAPENVQEQATAPQEQAGMPQSQTAEQPTESTPAAPSAADPPSVSTQTSGAAQEQAVPAVPTPDQTIRGFPSSTIVYVSDNAKKIHSLSDCSGMKRYTEMQLGEADAKGYEYCLNCWKE